MTLKALEYEPPTVEMMLDKDGFEVEAVAEDDEGFETTEEVEFAQSFILYAKPLRMVHP